MKFIFSLIILFAIPLRMYSQIRYLSDDSSKYDTALEEYCFNNNQKELDSLQKYKIMAFSIWAKKVHSKTVKVSFNIFAQPRIDLTTKELKFYYELVRVEFLRNGISKKQIRLEATFPNTPLVNFRGSCTEDVTVSIYPKILEGTPK